ncbi:MAG: hypothetical protein LIP11_08130 [Clostridiales bacterium]|nr:hypothetical protein [Clostridiales bacterium]
MEPGFRKVRFAPHPDRRIGKISGCFQSVMGEFRFGWEIKDHECVYFLQIPYGCSAVMELPGEEACTLYGGKYSVALSYR